MSHSLAVTLRVARAPNSAFVTASARVQPLLPSTSASSVVSEWLGLAHDEPKGAGKGQGAQRGSETTGSVQQSLGMSFIDWVWGRS